MEFKDLDIYLTVILTVKGSDYEPADFDGDEKEFRKWMVKEATAGIRHADMDIADAWLDRIEEA